MSQQTLGIIIGGMIPALLYGVCNVFTKFSLQTGIAIGYYLMAAGLTIMAVGLLFFFLVPQGGISTVGVLHAMGFGLTWGLGAGFVALAISRYHAPLSQIVPLFNMNTLIAVLLSLWIFAEWKEVHVVRLIIGSILIVAGGTLVAL